jgi:hypothetical protein
LARRLSVKGKYGDQLRCLSRETLRGSPGEEPGEHLRVRVETCEKAKRAQEIAVSRDLLVMRASPVPVAMSRTRIPGATPAARSMKGMKYPET